MNQLREHAELTEKKMAEEFLCESRIERLTMLNKYLRSQLKPIVEERYKLRSENEKLKQECEILAGKLLSALSSKWPLVKKSIIRDILEQSPLTQ